MSILAHGDGARRRPGGFCSSFLTHQLHDFVLNMYFLKPESYSYKIEIDVNTSVDGKDPFDTLSILKQAKFNTLSWTSA